MENLRNIRFKIATKDFIFYNRPRLFSKKKSSFSLPYVSSLSCPSVGILIHYIHFNWDNPFTLNITLIETQSIHFIKTRFAYSEEPLKEAFQLIDHTLLLLALAPPPPNRDTGGINLSMSVPVVLISPSRKAFSRNFRVSGSLSFSS